MLKQLRLYKLLRQNLTHFLYNSLILSNSRSNAYYILPGVREEWSKRCHIAYKKATIIYNFVLSAIQFH